MKGLLLLGIPLILCLQMYIWYYRRNVLKKIGIEENALSIVPRSRATFIFKTVALCLAWLLLVLSFDEYSKMAKKNAQSETNVHQKAGGEQRQAAQDVMLLIDASASMGVKDARQNASRLESAKEIAELVIQNLEGQNVALYAFTSDADQLAPPTPDYLFTIMKVRNLQINEGGATGTDLSSAVEAMVNQAKTDKTKKRRTVVIFSDGGDNALDSSGSSVQKLDEFLQKIEGLKKEGWDFIVVGMGTLTGGTVPEVVYQGQAVQSKLDERLLKKIANRYFTAYNMSSLDLAKQIAELSIRGGGVTKVTTTDKPPEEPGTDPRLYLLLALGLLSFVFFWPNAQTP